jgi:hypothetical protein
VRIKYWIKEYNDKNVEVDLESGALKLPSLTTTTRDQKGSSYTVREDAG